MEKLEWTDDLSVGVVEIDAQHKKEVELVNSLAENMADRDKAGQILDEMIEHTKLHFATEERYFDEFGYENSEEHKEIHKTFLGQAAQLAEDFKGGKDLEEGQLKFVADWLVDHITQTDKKYTKCFNEHGLR